MNLRDPVVVARELRRLEARIAKLEREQRTRDGEIIGETEHGDVVFAMKRKTSDGIT